MKNVNNYQSVLTYHTNTFGCGVAKFNNILAKKINCDVKQIFSKINLKDKFLLSLKISEFDNKDIYKLNRLINELRNFDIFFHDFSNLLVERKIIQKSSKIICGNKEIAEKILKLNKKYKAKIESLWSPSTIKVQQKIKKKINLLSFGMSHKVQITKFKKLKLLLDKRYKNNYCLKISLALHEYKSFDDEYIKPYNLIKKIFGKNLLFLGFASDEYLSQELRQCDYFVAFFEKGLRDNNSSVAAAVEHNCKIITNLDKNSPKFYFDNLNVINIDKVKKFPKKFKFHDDNSKIKSFQKSISWNNFVKKIFYEK